MSNHADHFVFIDDCSGGSPKVKRAAKLLMKVMVDGFARGQSIEDVVQLSGYDRSMVEAVIRRALRRHS